MSVLDLVDVVREAVCNDIVMTIGKARDRSTNGENAKTIALGRASSIGGSVMRSATSKRFSGVFRLAGWGAMVAMLATVPATAAACWQPEEYEAARVRDLQTMLMVSALQCRTADPEMPAAYNKFVGRAKPTLIEGEKALLAHFAREGDKLAYDRFTTALANKYAERAQHPEFCARAKRILAADEATGGALPTVAVLLNTRPAGVEEVCPAQRKSSVIVISPFAPLPEGPVSADAVPVTATPAEVATAAVTAPPAATIPAAAPAESAAPAPTP